MSIARPLSASLKYLLLSSVIVSAVPVSRCHGEELKDLLGRVQKLADEKNFPKALEELNWVQKELQKQHSTQLERFFPNEIKGFKGDKVKANAALGFSQVERTYTKGEQTITLSLAGGSSAGGIGNLAQLGKFAAMMGTESGQETIRVHGKTAQLEGDDESQYALSIFLESGSVLKLDASSGIKSTELKDFAEAILVEDLDKYLKG